MQNQVSVPSGDFLFFNVIHGMSMIPFGEVSVPSGDFLFFNNTEWHYQKRGKTRFRPLRGLLIF